MMSKAAVVNPLGELLTVEHLSWDDSLNDANPPRQPQQIQLAPVPAVLALS